MSQVAELRAPAVPGVQAEARAEAGTPGTRVWLALPLLGALLLLSGAAGLIYQVAWVRLLGLTFGVTVYAISTVLAAFMGGLAIGSVFGGRLADRLTHPLRTYGLVEIGVGATALLTPLLFFDTLQGLYREVALLVDPQRAPLVAGGVRLALTFGVLLVPTALMGATLPLVVRTFRHWSTPRGQEDQNVEKRDSLAMGALYALNTTGAIAGTLGAGFILIGQLGITGSVFFAAGLNLLAGLGAMLLSALWRDAPQSSEAAQRLPRREVDAWPPLAAGEAARVESERASADATHASAEARGAQPASTDSRLAATATGNGSVAIEEASASTRVLAVPPALAFAAFAVFGVSGGISLAYEVVWSRILAILFDSTIYGFVLMLGTVLFGIAVGSAIAGAAVSRFASARFSGLAFGWIEVGIGVAAVLALGSFGVAFDLLVTLREHGPGIIQRALRTDTRLMALLCVATVLPASLLMGATFPPAARLWAAGAGRLGERLGGVYAVNVAGAIVGSLAAGFVLVPWIGAHASLLLLVALNVALGGWLLWATTRRLLAPALGLALGAAALGVGAWMPPVHERVFHQRFGDQELVWYQEGLENTVSVGRNPENVLRLYTNSLSQTNDTPDLVRYHKVMGHLAALLAPHPERVLVVGIGGGATPGAIAQHSGTHLALVELSEAVVEAAPFFAHINGNLLEQPNVTLTVDDGRNFLLRTQEKFDIIIADIVPPTHAGATNLYSVEYFRLASRALTPDGIMVQWVSPENAFGHELITRTFLEAFPHSTLWLSGDLLVGSNRPLEVDLERLRARLEDPAARAALHEVGFQKPEDVLFHFRADAEELRRYVGEGPILTDDRPLLEYFRSVDIPPAPADLSGFSGDERRIVQP